MKREEQIIQASEEWTYQTPPQYSELVHKSPKVMCAYQVGFIDGAVWADSTMLERACEWLQHNVYRFYWNNCAQQEHGVYIDKLVEQFKQAMEE